MIVLGATDSDIMQAVDMIKSGKLVAFPTETVYGLGADIYNANAVNKIFEAKQRATNKPLAAHISDLKMAEQISSIIPDLFYDLANIFLPGPLTMIIPASASLPQLVTAHTNTIAIRFPANAICQRFIDAVGSPLAATSVNMSDATPANSINEFPPELQSTIAAVIDGGESALKVASTVINLIGRPTIVREGAIKTAEIEGKIGRKLFL